MKVNKNERRLVLAIVMLLIPLSGMVLSIGFASAQVDNGAVIEDIYMTRASEKLEKKDVYYEWAVVINFVTDRDLKAVNASLIKKDRPDLFPIQLEVKGEGTSYKIQLELSKYFESHKAGDYDLIVYMTDKSNKFSNQTYEKFLTIITKNPEASFSLQIDSRIFIFGGIGVGIVLVVVLVMRRKKMGKTLSDIDKNLKQVDEREVSKSKRRERVIGASAVGKSSGIEAEMKHSKQTDAAPETAPTKQSSGRSIIRDRQKETNVKMVDLDAKRQAEMKAPETEEDIAALLSSKPPSAIQMKAQESSLDLDRKSAFLESKIDSLNQNLLLSKMILEQTNYAVKKEQDCPKCGYKYPVDESQCPNCAVNKIDQKLLKEKLQNAEPIGAKSLCLVCKKIVEEGWSECPYCLESRRQQ